LAKVGVIGCGAWATTMAKLLAENEHAVRLWCHDSKIAEDINQRHLNSLCLPSVGLPEEIEASTDLSSVVNEASVLILGVASSFVDIVKQIVDGASGKPILILTKGLLEDQDHLFVSDYVGSILGEQNVGILSGPNLAGEIAEGLPAATVIASRNDDVSTTFQSLLSNSYFRVYTSKDVRGVELGGLLKNIYAIAAGALDGKGLGSNAKSALMSRSLQEMIRFGMSYGAEQQTFFGLSGLGDLITTCSSKKSRNWRVGHALAETGSLDEAIKAVSGAVAEGVKTSKIVNKVAVERNIEMPIASEIYRVLFEGKPLEKALDALMNRELKPERDA